MFVDLYEMFPLILLQAKAVRLGGRAREASTSKFPLILLQAKAVRLFWRILTMPLWKFPLILLQAKAVRRKLRIPKGITTSVSINSPSGEGGEHRDRNRLGWQRMFPLILLQAKAVSLILCTADFCRPQLKKFPLILLQAKAVSFSSKHIFCRIFRILPHPPCFH